ncbi:E3 ubiquitin-protein ligase MARCHF2 [Rhipicephalus microplus]|uniref:E3 ubiquitin-protein ligase MARCHF2 n=1 Tax=Rhipicephalus microplus TaxID=6941 RepID=UPI003F6C6118
MPLLVILWIATQQKYVDKGQAMEEVRAAQERTEGDAAAEEAAVAPRSLEKQEDNAEKVCRVCYCEADLENGPLFQPCSCRGTIGFGHKRCIEACLNKSGDLCSICLTRIKCRRKRPPLWHFFSDFNWENMSAIACSVVSFACPVSLLVATCVCVVQSRYTQDWISNVLAIAGFILCVVFASVVLIVEWSIVQQEYQAWIMKTTTTELILPNTEVQKDPLKKRHRLWWPLKF